MAFNELMRWKGRKEDIIVSHDEFIKRIRKSLYLADNKLQDEVSRPLADYVSELFSETHKGHSLNRLNSVGAGNVHVSPCSLIIALIYLDRLNVTDPTYIRKITPHELFIISVIISTKFYAGHDEEVYLSDWVDDGNFTGSRLKHLELEYLKAIDWKLFISNEQFFSKLKNVEAVLARQEGLRRGWLTYTELCNLLPSLEMAKFLLKNFTLLAISYAASLLTIGSAFLLVNQMQSTILPNKQISIRASYNQHSESNLTLYSEPAIEIYNGCDCNSFCVTDFDDGCQNISDISSTLKTCVIPTIINNNESLCSYEKILESNSIVMPSKDNLDFVKDFSNCTHHNPLSIRSKNEYIDSIFWLKLI